MKRLVSSLVGLGVLLLVLFAPAACAPSEPGDEPAPADATAGSEPTTITSYVADFDLAEDGDLEVVETLIVDFPSAPSRHGIFRFWDRLDQTNPDVRRVVEDVEVTLDGDDVQVEMEKRDRGRFDVARIGDPDSYVSSGEHVYEISYRIDGVIEPGTDGTESQFYWQLIPAGWAQDIEGSELTVSLPAPAEELQCAVGIGDDTVPCAVDGEGTDELRITTGALARNTPVTLKAGLDLATPEPGTAPPWSARFDPVLGTSVPVLLVVLAVGALVGVGGLVLARTTFERNPQFPLMYAPPDGLGPAQATYVLQEEVDREAYVATLMHAAQHGAIDLDKDATGWTIRDKAGPDGWRGLDEVSTSVAHLLSGAGSSFTASPESVSAGERLKKEIAAFEAKTTTWGASSGNLARAGVGGVGAMLVLACLVGAVAIVIWNPSEMSILGVVPGAFAVLGAPLALPGAGTRRTRQGRELWSRVGGFRRILSTPSSQDRFDFSGREELYTAYIPWAVAFGCADEWAAKYRTEMGAEPPVPRYFGGAYAGAATGSYVSSMVSDFNSTVSSAISSYQATQSSSSSGGGGFSGGGGGGGGGGGSW